MKRIIYCLAMCAVTMIAGGYFTAFGTDTWYHSLLMPPGTPADSIFPIAWSIIYLLIAAAFAIAFAKCKDANQCGKINSLFINQLFLHILWCFCFFYTGYIMLALLVILLLDIIVFRTIYAFYGLPAGVAAVILLPYCGWILFATYLNAAFVWLNGFVISF